MPCIYWNTLDHKNSMIHSSGLNDFGQDDDSRNNYSLTSETDELLEAGSFMDSLIVRFIQH